MTTTRRSQREHLPSLLLLPFPPNPASRECLNAAYRPCLKAALQKLKDDASPSSPVLIVAIACPILHGPYLRHKTLSWAEAQSLVAGVYTVISVLCAQLSIATDVRGGAGSVDARVVLVDHGRDRDRRFTAEDFRPAIEPNSTAVVDLPTFASAYFPWNLVFHPDSEAGHQLYATYMRLAEGNQVFLQEQLVTVPGGVTLNVADAGTSSDASQSQQTGGYSTVCLGGTFDHLHPGHKLLLAAGAYLLKVPERGSSATCHYIIGVTGDEMLKKKKFVEYVQPWPERARNVIEFLASILELSPTGWKDASSPKIVENGGDYRVTFREGTISIQCVEFQDLYGPTVTREEIEALVVSGETRSGGKAVNDKRIEQGWKALDVFEVDVLDASEITDEATKTQDFASKISSTAIRQQKAEAAARAGAS